MNKRPQLVWLAALLLPAALLWWVCHPPERCSFSALAKAPDWSRLDIHQGTIGRERFSSLLQEVYMAGEGWRDWMEFGSDGVAIRSHGQRRYLLRFGNQRPAPDAGYWRAAADLPAAPVGKPLAGLHIAIDPGHIGGQWAQLEARWLVVDGQAPVCEGDMTLLVAQLLKPRLEGLGARVSLVREGSQPVTDLRPEDLLAEARKELGGQADQRQLRLRSEMLFYRTAEIRARAELVNRVIRPDLVLCLHFNADDWGDPSRPTLVEGHHFHILVHGGYGDDEVALEDQRHAMVSKILAGTHEEETAVAGCIADVFGEATSMPPFRYSPEATHVRSVKGQPCLWARNLLANRLYECPVVFLEPYVMNSRIDHPRMLAGDYVGVREVAGKPQISIFREYAEVVCAGLVRHYGKRSD